MDQFTPADLAVQQLETALNLFSDGTDYISALTLAGAAEEILGHIAKAKTGTHALETEVDILRQLHKIFLGLEMQLKDAIYDVNLFKNLAKHATESQTPVIHMDAREEAADLIERALKNYEIAIGPLTIRMEAFLEARFNRH